MAINGRLRHGRGCVRQSPMRPPADSGVSLREGIISSRNGVATRMKRHG